VGIYISKVMTGKHFHVPLLEDEMGKAYSMNGREEECI
jgi:hypothetical protein